MTLASSVPSISVSGHHETYNSVDKTAWFSTGDDALLWCSLKEGIEFQLEKYDGASWTVAKSWWKYSPWEEEEYIAAYPIFPFR